MTELLEPFLAEAHELLEQAGEDLLALEREPDSQSHLDSLFRAFHTLKGSAALLDLAPMTHAMHAAEDLLSALRRRSGDGSGMFVDACFEALDQVAAWLTALERSGELPREAATRGEELAATLRDALPRSDEGSGGPRKPAGPPDWARAFADSQAGKILDGSPAERSYTAIRYVPAQDSFLNGDDPLALVRRVPDLLALEIEPGEAWPPLGEVDPFSANLVILMLARDKAADLAAIFRLVSDQVEYAEVRVGGSPSRAHALGPVAAAIIDEQRVLLAASQSPAARVGTVRSALTVVANVLASEGRPEAAERLRHDAAAQADPLTAIAAALSDESETVGEAVAVPQDGAPLGRTLRVDVGRVDALAGLVSELTIARNALAHAVARIEAGNAPEPLVRALGESDAAIGRLAGDLHRSVMRLRMVPLSGVFRRFARPVRELAAQLGKAVLLETSGEEIEADRTVVDSLFELLLHVIRNAVDHGIESEAERRAAGKPAAGRLKLVASTARDRIVIDVEDDGRGIDPARLRARAIERGLLSSAAASTAPDEDILDLIFAPGFSTTSGVTDISGRGVGMDAVRSGAQRLGGQVEVMSRVGQGTTIRLRLPQTMTLTPLMAVAAGSETFGVPLQSVVELRRIAPDDLTPVKSGLALAWRGRTIPVVWLADRMSVARGAPPAAHVDLLVVQAGGGLVGLMVDGVIGRTEAVVRPLGGVFAGLPGLSGTTVLGNGGILLVLDLEEVLA